jgi:hypothetical protein
VPPVVVQPNRRQSLLSSYYSVQPNRQATSPPAVELIDLSCSPPPVARCSREHVLRRGQLSLCSFFALLPKKPCARQHTPELIDVDLDVSFAPEQSPKCNHKDLLRKKQMPLCSYYPTLTANRPRAGSQVTKRRRRNLYRRRQLSKCLGPRPGRRTRHLSMRGVNNMFRHRPRITQDTPESIVDLSCSPEVAPAVAGCSHEDLLHRGQLSLCGELAESCDNAARLFRTAKFPSSGKTLVYIFLKTDTFLLDTFSP